MKTSFSPSTCPKCGGAILSEAPQGLCPKCLLEQISIPTETGANACSAPPGRDELAAAFPELQGLELIGQGGMGFVFRARQVKLDRYVALKILPQSLADQPAFAERFAREGRLLARLSHPNIVTIYDFGQANGFFYLLMEFVDGVNLRQAMRAGRFTPGQALAIVPKICEALQFAHTEGVLHRDIKPENILLDSKGRVKIADFGIAKLIGDPQPDITLTGSGKALGTAHYAAPEQVETPSQVDHRADIYSLGVVFYEMLTGELPIGRFAPPSENCGVDPRIDEVVFRALDKKPERRPQSAAEVKTEVETITHTPRLVAASPYQAPEVRVQSRSKFTNGIDEETRPPTGARWKALAISAGLTLLLLGVVALVWQFAPGVWNLHAAATPEPNSTSTNQSGPAVTTPMGGEVATNEPFTREFLLDRATNQPVGSATWTASIWSDIPLRPGESLSARASLDNGPISDQGCSSLQYVSSRPERVGTSVSLTWFFGGAIRPDFGASEAQAAAAQLGAWTARPLPLTAGKPVELFSVTSPSGHVLTGYAEFTRLVSKPGLAAASDPKPQAIIHVRSFQAYLPALTYSVKLPPGYALRPTVNLGQVSTHSGSPKPGDYRISWFIPMTFHQTSLAAEDLPAQMNAQRSMLQTRFQELQDLGPIPIVYGKPFTVFSITNKLGGEYRACLELVKPGDIGKEEAAAKPAPYLSPSLLSGPRYITPQNRQFTAPPTGPQKTGVTRQATSLPRIDPATGLPLPPGATSTARIDPLTGLPVGYVPPFPLPTPGTNVGKTNHH